MKQHKITELHLEQYLLGELDESIRHQIDTIATYDHQVREWLQQARLDNQRFERNYPYRSTRLIKLPETERYGNERLPWMSAAVTAAVVVVGSTLILQNGVNEQSFPISNEDTVRLKGMQPQLQLYKKTSNGVLHLANGDLVKMNDSIQISYLAAGDRYGVIFSIDGRGSVSLHYPTEPSLASELKNSGEIVLPFALKLDDAPSYERFFMVTSNSNLDAQSVIERARFWANSTTSPSTDNFVLASDVRTHSFILYK